MSIVLLSNHLLSHKIVLCPFLFFSKLQHWLFIFTWSIYPCFLVHWKNRNSWKRIVTKLYHPDYLLNFHLYTILSFHTVVINKVFIILSLFSLSEHWIVCPFTYLTPEIIQHYYFFCSLLDLFHEYTDIL